MTGKGSNVIQVALLSVICLAALAGQDTDLLAEMLPLLIMALQLLQERTSEKDQE